MAPKHLKVSPLMTYIATAERRGEKEREGERRRGESERGGER